MEQKMGQRERQGEDKPRFHRDMLIPAIPDGFELVKVDGEPGLVPQQDEGELLVIGTKFTRRQILVIGKIMRNKRAHLFD